MSEITTTEEMLACNEAIRQNVRQFADTTFDPEEEADHAVLRQMWMAGRDWADSRPEGRQDGGAGA